MASGVPNELGDATSDFECTVDASEVCGGREAINVCSLPVVEPGSVF